MCDSSDDNCSSLFDMEDQLDRLAAHRDAYHSDIEPDENQSLQEIELERRIIREELEKMLKSTPQHCENIFSRFNCNVELKSPPKSIITQQTEEEPSKIKFPYLKRGTGLARFRMSDKDFEKPPEIYKSLIKVNQEPKNIRKKQLPKTPVRKLVLRPVNEPKIQDHREKLEEKIEHENFCFINERLLENISTQVKGVEGPVTIEKQEMIEKEAMRKPSEREIAIKVRQKALQDNVKNILSWNVKKNSPKKFLKRAKVKKVVKVNRAEKPKICDLMRRLKELEDEKETFKNENLKLKKIQKEWLDEKVKLDKERKEAEKELKLKWEELQVEKDKLHEEFKRLQKEKLVFEKHTRPIKNQPAKEEREEIKKLKEEIVKLKESISVKDSRYGAAQARLRNTIKLLESENNRLKSEIEELNKKVVKRVSFEPRKVFSTKILNAINAELDKKTEKRPLLRRAKSAGVLMKKQEVKEVKEAEVEEIEAEKALSADSGMGSGGTSPDLEIQPENSRLIEESTAVPCSNVSAYNAILELKQRVGKLMTGLPSESSSQSVKSVKEPQSEAVERILPTGEHETTFPCGKRRLTSADGNLIRTYFPNGDISEFNLKTNAEKYFYSQSRIWQTSFRDRPGFQIVETPDGRTVRYLPDGTVETQFSNGAVVRKDRNGSEEWKFKTGEVVRTEPNGDKILIFPSGRREITTNGYTRLEEPNGIVKMLYADGTQETRFPTGRVRVKDKNGCLLMDTGGFR